MTPRRSALAVTVALASCLVVAEPALAGTVSLEAGVFSYRSDPGEVDSLRVVAREGYIGVGDLNATLPSVGPGCVDMRAMDPFADPPVRCPLQPGAPLPRLQLDFGDGSDGATAAGGLRGEINAGAGNDDVFGAGRLNGGPGDDSLEGPGRLAGGPGRDQLQGEGRNDVLLGGPGADFLSHEFAPGPARLIGGPGSDYINGSSGADVLRGGTGTDQVAGDAGRDLIDLGPGVDAAAGWEGADLVRARDGRFDYVECWSGRDTATLDRFDLYERDCERVRRRGVARSVLYGAAVYLRADGHEANELEIAFTCPYDGPRVCDPTLLVHTRRQLVLRGVGPTRDLGDQGWLWGLRPGVLVALSRWARITMLARDALGRPYRQTIVCTEGAVSVEPPSTEAVNVLAPLTNSRTCDPQPNAINPWVF